MLPVFMAASVPVMKAGLTSDTHGFTLGGIGTLRKDLQALLDESSALEQLTYRVFTGDVTLKVTGDKRTFLSTKTLTVGPTDLDLSTASSSTYDAGDDVTTLTLTPGSQIIENGKAYFLALN